MDENNLNNLQESEPNNELNNQNTNNNDNDIEVVLGDDSNLIISSVGDLMNDLKPKVQKRENIVIPIAKKPNNPQPINQNTPTEEPTNQEIPVEDTTTEQVSTEESNNQNIITENTNNTIPEDIPQEPNKNETQTPSGSQIIQTELNNQEENN